MNRKQAFQTGYMVKLAALAAEHEQGQVKRATMGKIMGMGSSAMGAMGQAGGNLARRVGTGVAGMNPGFMQNMLAGSERAGLFNNAGGSMPASAMGSLGKAVMGRTAAGAGMAAGGAMALQAPGVHANNQHFEFQQNHPIIAYLMRMFGMSPQEAYQHASYFAPHPGMAMHPFGGH